MKTQKTFVKKSRTKSRERIPGGIPETILEESLEKSFWQYRVTFEIIAGRVPEGILKIILEEFPAETLR